MLLSLSSPLFVIILSSSVSSHVPFYPTYIPTYSLFLFKFKMVVKTVLDTLILFVNYTDAGNEGGNGTGIRSGRDSPQRIGSPDSASGFNTAQLLKEAVDLYSDDKGIHTNQ